MTHQKFSWDSFTHRCCEALQLLWKFCVCRFFSNVRDQHIRFRFADVGHSLFQIGDEIFVHFEIDLFPLLESTANDPDHSVEILVRVFMEIVEHRGSIGRTASSHVLYFFLRKTQTDQSLKCLIKERLIKCLKLRNCFFLFLFLLFFHDSTFDQVSFAVVGLESWFGSHTASGHLFLRWFLWTFLLLCFLFFLHFWYFAGYFGTNFALDRGKKVISQQKLYLSHIFNHRISDISHTVFEQLFKYRAQLLHRISDLFRALSPFLLALLVDVFADPIQQVASHCWCLVSKPFPDVIENILDTEAVAEVVKGVEGLVNHLCPFFS